jgi:exopolysaccharide biosynthesis polyprenyl glycosylphosphotransferase
VRLETSTNKQESTILLIGYEDEEVYVVSIYSPLDNQFNTCAKRCFDIVFSAAAIALTLPLMIVIAIVIRATSRGPVLFRQERIGKDNNPFIMYKFRTMVVSDESTACTRWTIRDDPRVTKLGAFLRKTSLDEIPQFLNVIRGQMSVSGPRPERLYFVNEFAMCVPNYLLRHKVKPGITGWAQVNGWRGNTSIETRLEYDIYYIHNWSLWLDIKIIFLTITQGLWGPNAY